MKNKIQEISDEIFSSICGFDEVKESIVLQLFGDLNILLIGDYGITKSKFLEIINGNFKEIKCIENITDEEKKIIEESFK